MSGWNNSGNNLQRQISYIQKPLVTQKMKISVSIIINYLAVFVWCSVIFWFSNHSKISTVESSAVDFFFKKTAHLVEYAILTVLIFRATKNIKLSIILSILYAASDEFHQSFIPGREPRVRDVIIDATGSTIGVILWSKLYLKTKTRPNK